MENLSTTSMPKPFDNEPDLNNSLSSGFELHDDERQELLKVQDEIVTLRQVLAAKIKREQELKTLLGMGFVDDLKHDFAETMNDIKSTNAFQKTAETFQAATDKIAPTLQNVNTSFKTRLGFLRNSTYFKTFENTIGSTVNAVKSKVSSSKSVMNFSAREHDDHQVSMSTSVTHDEHLYFADKK